MAQDASNPPALIRRPRGYVGTLHETIGSDILAVLGVITEPAQVLGPKVSGRLSTVTPDGWYPIEWLIEVMEILDQRVGAMGLRQMGRKLFKATHAERVKELAHSAKDIVTGMNDMYHHANRGDQIGGWLVKEFGVGRALMEKNTPHHCGMEEGILCEALMVVGVPAVVLQTECFRKGAEFCTFQISSAFIGREWSGEPT